MRFIHSIVVPEQAIAADGVYNWPLGVNPLSMLLVCLRPLNDTGTLADYNRYYALMKSINRISVLYQGQSIITCRGEDLAALNWLRRGVVPDEANPDDVNNERRAVVLPVYFGKQPFDNTSCLPASPRGSLTLELDLDIADTGYDTLRLSVESIELPEAKPSEFERITSFQQTFAATGQVDVDLAIGHKTRGVLLFGTTPFAGATPAPSWGRVKTLVDNVEEGFAASDWEVCKMLPFIFGRSPSMLGHKHKTTVDGNAQTAVETLDTVCDIDEDWTQYAFLDFDPTRDDRFTLDLNGKSRFQIRAEAETADAVRAIQVESCPMSLLGG